MTMLASALLPSLALMHHSCYSYSSRAVLLVCLAGSLTIRSAAVAACCMSARRYEDCHNSTVTSVNDVVVKNLRHLVSLLFCFWVLSFVLMPIMLFCVCVHACVLCVLRRAVLVRAGFGIHSSLVFWFVSCQVELIRECKDEFLTIKLDKGEEACIILK